MSKLAGFSLEELQEEIDSRKHFPPPMPIDLDEIEWSLVLDNVESLILKVEAGDSLPEDFEDEVFRTVMEVVYGFDVWEWWNNKLKGR
jgi:hypothetical protein